MEQPLIVQAEFSFRGGNNDELCFKKGDIITVTQREEGGWWEGTLSDKTGWFPSNYVKEYKAPLPISETIRPPEEIQEYRSVVLKDLLESEHAHVAEIQGLLENFLEPLQTSQILNSDEYAQLMCNFIEIVQTHEDLYRSLEDCNDRVGKLFLTKAPIMKNVHQAYCAAHPRAIVILDKYKDELEKYMEGQGAASPGLLVLTTGLSKPFRRLDKYSAMLQELERHMENSHPDRGDTQRSVAVYKEIAATCSATRRQKELELQVLTGPVRGWQGQELSTLGDIIHMGSVAVGSDHRDRYFVLFPQTLLILSVSQRMSAFIYEGKLPLTGIEVNRLEDTDILKNALEINGPLIEKIIAVCQGPNEANKWVELLASTTNSSPINIKRNISSGSINVPQFPSHMSPPANLGLNHPTTRNTPPINQLSQHKRSLSFNHHLSYNQYYTNNNNQHQPHQHHQNHQGMGAVVAGQNHKSNLVPISNNISKMMGGIGMVPAAAAGQINHHQGILAGLSGRTGSIRANWSITNLHSAPPLRPNLLNQNTTTTTSGCVNSIGGAGNSGSSNSSNHLSSYCSSRKVQPTYEEDALVLRVIEAYCAAYQNNARNTIHSALQPWTPCLPIRGGKLKTSKPFSTSNPQLPFLCAGNTSNSPTNFQSCNPSSQKQNSSSSLNSSYIWREASPNNFNMYSASVSSLNTAYRYSLGGISNAGPGNTIAATTAAAAAKKKHEYRSNSEDRTTTQHNKYYNNNNSMSYRYKTGSGYDNIYMTPLLPRKHHKQQNKISSKNTYQTHHRTPPPQQQQTITRNHSTDSEIQVPLLMGKHQQQQQQQHHQQNNHNAQIIGLYDRRLNRSFESPQQSYMKQTPLRRSTPHLADTDDCIPKININRDSQRLSATWCCGNFVMKQLRKMHTQY